MDPVDPDPEHRTALLYIYLETAGNDELVIRLLGADAVELEVDQVGAQAPLGSRQV